MWISPLYTPLRLAARIGWFLHVPLDSSVLQALRKLMPSVPAHYRIDLPTKPRMGTIADLDMYRKVLAAAGEGAILAVQAEPHRECWMAVSGDSVAWCRE
jgi:hypothetical protein